MSTNAVQSAAEIVLERIVNAAPELVFDAWTKPEILKTWWGRREGRLDWPTTSAAIDARPGGAYRFRVRSPKGDEISLVGSYTAVERPSRLAFTQHWEIGGEQMGDEQPIDVAFAPFGDKTRVTFRKTGFASPEMRDCELEGWSECIDKLVTHFHMAKQSADDEAEIRAMIDAWERAMVAKDVDGIMAGYAPDALVFDAIPPYKTVGAAELRAAWEACLPCFPEKFTVERADSEVTVGSDVAFSRLLHHVKPIGGDSHPAGQTWLRITSCFRKIEGRWRIVHEHISVPFNPIDEKVWYIRDLADLSNPWIDSVG